MAAYRVAEGIERVRCRRMLGNAYPLAKLDLNQLEMAGQIGGRFQCDRHMTTRDWKDALVEVAIPDHEVPNASAIDIAALTNQCQHRWIDQELFVSI
jgi:hypothetical protein